MVNTPKGANFLTVHFLSTEEAHKRCFRVDNFLVVVSDSSTVAVDMSFTRSCTLKSIFAGFNLL